MVIISKYIIANECNCRMYDKFLCKKKISFDFSIPFDKIIDIEPLYIFIRDFDEDMYNGEEFVVLVPLKGQTTEEIYSNLFYLFR